MASGIRRIEALTGEGALADYQRHERAAGGAGGAAARGRRRGQRGAGAPDAGPKAGGKAAGSRAAQIGHLQARYAPGAETGGPGRGGRALRPRWMALPARGFASWWTRCGRRWDRAFSCWRRWKTAKVALLASVTKELTNRLHAGKIIQSVAKELGGQGRRPSRSGRGWRKRHIQPKNCPRPGLPPG